MSSIRLEGEDQIIGLKTKNRFYHTCAGELNI